MTTLKLDSDDTYAIQLYKMGSVKFGDVISRCKYNMSDSFDKYQAVDNNCQRYILELLQAYFDNIHLQMPKVYKDYIFQDVSKILEKDSFASKLSTKITDRVKTFENACSEIGEDPENQKFHR